MKRAGEVSDLSYYMQYIRQQTCLMARTSLVLLAFLIADGSARAQGTTHTLFAVDLSLSASDKSAAFEIIRESTLNTTNSQAIGLTLFDDSVRRYVPPVRLDIEQTKLLNQTLAQAPESLHSTSNLAVGIERAIDAFSPEGGANLIVFGRGIIDTPADDSRARFNEWLDKILLPQAVQSNIKITLVVPQSLAAESPIKQAFARTGSHQIVTSAYGAQIAPELVLLLGVSTRTYGASDSSENADSSVTPDTLNQPGSEQPVSEQPGSEQLGSEQLGSEQLGSEQPGLDQPDDSQFPMARTTLLVLALILLGLILIWRTRARRLSRLSEDSTTGSSTYLPLTEKPSDTMDHWLDKQTDLPPDAYSSKDDNVNPQLRSTVIRPAEAASDSDATVLRPAANPSNLAPTAVRHVDPASVRKAMGSKPANGSSGSEDTTVLRPSDKTPNGDVDVQDPWEK